MLTLLIDNHDSYTFNLFQALAQVNGVAPLVVRNDERRWDELQHVAFDNIVLSPGPGHPGNPRDFGVCAAALAHADVPVLGVCLGHQGLALAEGGDVAEADEPVHGRLSAIFHTGDGLFTGLPQGFQAVRYHSLAVRSVPASLRTTAWTQDGVVMGLADPGRGGRARYGVQFHPESVASEYGDRLLENFRDLTRTHASGRRAPSALPYRTGGCRSARGGQDVPVPAPAALEVRLRRVPHPPEAETVFLELFADAPDAFWLDSSLARAAVSRFSFMGDARGPLARVLTHDAATPTTVERHASGATTTTRGDLLTVLAERLREHRSDAPAAPFQLVGGYVGWLGYELDPHGGPPRRTRPGDLPDAGLIFADRLLAFDHEAGELHLVCLAPPGDAAATRWLDGTAARLARMARTPAPPPEPGSEDGPLHVRATRTRSEYEAQVHACHAIIRRGDSYELCLTDELRITTGVDPLTLYRVLRARSPAPHAAFVRIGGVTLVSSSPERFLSVDRAGRVESRPIKGTAPRGADPDTDARARDALAASEKDRAEHLMIVDLVRHDLGSVCEIGSITVPELMVVESYAAVHQLVSSVRGVLARGRGATDAVRAAFPPGSMTGAPKERTLELLDALEARPRGPYAGALGYLAVNGTADLAVTIRAAVCARGEVRIGTGGAVVLQSDPAAEHDELLLKARAVVQAVARAACGDAAAHDLETLSARAQPGASVRPI
jgi:para-aminobenzoate synthetase